MDSLQDRVKQIKQDISDLSEKKAKLVGKEEQKLHELIDKFGIDNLDSAEKLLNELIAKIETNESTLSGLCDELDSIIESA